MSTELPNGWVKVALTDICLPVAKIQPNLSPEKEFTYIEIGSIDNTSNKITETKNVKGRSAPSRARQVIEKGDILFSTVRTYLRKIALVEQEYKNPVASTGFVVLRAANGVSPKFLFFQILSEKFLQPIHALQSGSSYPAVHNRDVLSQPILLPPTLEQNQIAEKLSVMFTGLERADLATRRALERLDRYRTSTLQVAVTGGLTHKWRESQRRSRKNNLETGKSLLHRILLSRRTCWEKNELLRLRSKDEEPTDNTWKSFYSEPRAPNIIGLPKLPEGWTWVTPEQVASGTRYSLAIGPFGSNLKVSDYQDSGVPLVFVRNIRTGVFLDEKTRFISHKKSIELKAHRVVGGDILITKMGNPPGDACLYPENLPSAVITADCIRFHLSSLLKATNLFFVHSINSKICRDQILKITKGVAQQKISLSRFSSIALPLPPLSEQRKIVSEVQRLLSAASQLQETLMQQLRKTNIMRQSLLSKAFAGHLIPQNPSEDPAFVLLERIREEKSQKEAELKLTQQDSRSKKGKKSDIMHDELPSPKSLQAAWEKIGRKADAKLLFDAAGFGTDCVEQFYEILRDTPEVRSAFQETAQRDYQPPKLTKSSQKIPAKPKGRFRLVELWLEDFKNLKDYTICFDPTHSLDVILGWNGTGKSNLFEALVIIFRDLYEWWNKNHWPEKPMNGYRICYEIDGKSVVVTWQPRLMKRPELKMGSKVKTGKRQTKLKSIKRDQLLLPHFIFGYYSGPTNRLAEHFWPMKWAHYNRLRDAKTDTTETMTNLLEQRRFFCAETHHAKYVLLAFSYKKDHKIREFLRKRLRIRDFKSALFVIRKPRWAKQNSKAEDFWGARGIMRQTIERLRHYAIAPMVLEQTINDGYRSTTEKHYYLYLPDLESLHSFAAEYEDARTFFMALESIDFSELIYDAKIQVSIESTNNEQIPITFHELSEGEQQLLMVMGLMRFTQSHGSLVLLDEPDTHLNPHWSVDYLKDLTRVIGDNDFSLTKQQTSQIIIATHDPLVIASLVKEQVNLLKRDIDSLKCYWEQASEDPRGLGFTGILTSDMFGFRSDLDSETLSLLDKQVQLIGKRKLNKSESERLEKLTHQIENLGFKSTSSDPYYREFLKAIARRQKISNLFRKQIRTKSELEALQHETDKILREIEEEEAFLE